MKKLLFAFLVLLGTSFGQVAARFDLGGPIAGVTTTSSVNGSNYLIALPGVRLNWCSYPANSTQGTPCTNYSPTFTSTALTTACPSNQPIVLQNSNVCQGTSDNYGNLGVFYDASVAIHSYTLTYGSKTYGPFIYGPGGSGGGTGAGGAPNQSVSFFSAFSANVQISGANPNITWDCWDNNSPANGIAPDTVTVSSAFVVTFTFVQPQSGYCSVNSSSGSGNGPIGGISGVTTLNGTGLIGGANSGTANLSLLNTCLQAQILAWDTVNGWGCANSVGVSGSPALGQQAVGNGNIFISQTKAAIDVRDTTGVDCTGATDSSTALNVLFSNISNKRVVIPNSCTLQVQTGLVIDGQTNFILEGNNHQGTSGEGSQIGGCPSSASGFLLTINRSSYFTVRDILFVDNLVAGLTACGSSNYTGGISVTNSGGGGFTPTYAYFEGVGVTHSIQGATGPTNYIGIQNGGGANMEQFTVRDSWINCQNALNSYGVRQYGANADLGVVERDRIASCFQGVRTEVGAATIRKTLFGGVGNFSIFGANGAAIYLGNSINPTIITSNESDTGGAFINTGNNCSASAPSSTVTIDGNAIATSDLGAAQYVIGAGCSLSGKFSVTNNRFYIDGSIGSSPVALIGNSAAGAPFGPNGNLVEYGNTSNFVFGAAAPLLDAAHWQGGQFQPDDGLNTYDLTYGYQNSFRNDSTGAPRSAKLTFESKGTNGLDDFTLGNILNGAQGTSSTMVIDHHKGNATGSTYLAIQPQIGGGLNLVAVPDPVVTGGTDFVSHAGAAGAATWTYKMVGISGGGCHTAASAALTTTTGNATLTTSNYNIVSYVADPGIIYYNVYRTASGGTPSTTGLIGTLYVSAVLNNSSSGTNTFNDTGLAGDSSTPPATNTCTGNLVAGQVTGTTYNTATNCAAVGTAASPSVASCGSASAGHFSCATNATGATCAVNTTAVTANSEIFVFESDTAVTGTALGVTCNTSTNVLPTSRLLASSVAATSFTINLGTVTTNPACFSYEIKN